MKKNAGNTKDQPSMLSVNFFFVLIFIITSTLGVDKLSAWPTESSSMWLLYHFQVQLSTFFPQLLYSLPGRHVGRCYGLCQLV